MGRSVGEMSLLDDELLERFRLRAADDDERNVFCTEDLAELRAIGYLALFVPAELGGPGLGLEETAAEQARLATAAPATALAVNMHLVWTGVARALLERGDDSLRHVPVAGLEVRDDGDTLGMRATQSRTTVLDGVVVPPGRIIRSLPVGPTPDPFVFAIFVTFEVLISSVYLGLARRALELGVAAVRRRISLRADGRPVSEDPVIRHRVAEAAIMLDSLDAPLRSAAADVDALVDRGAHWAPSLVGVKVRTTEAALRIVESAVRLSGGSAYVRRSELSRLYRDVLAGLFHPSDDDAAHATVAALWLGPMPPASEFRPR